MFDSMCSNVVRSLGVIQSVICASFELHTLLIVIVVSLLRNMTVCLQNNRN